MKMVYMLIISILLSFPNLSKSQVKDRETARQDYNNNYMGSAFTIPEVGWTGNQVTCNAGTISASVLSKAAQRINYYRRMVGVADNVVLENTRNAKCQQAALMMIANNELNHSPPSGWICWTPGGSEAAGASNLAFGDLSTDIYIEDSGSGNLFVAHRRYVLHSKAQIFGCGMIPEGQYAHALWVIGNEGNPAVFNNFIAYPPDGYIPKDLVFPRWSFSIPNVNSATAFTNATVHMIGPNGNVPLNIISRTDNYADPTIVWEPSNIDNTNTQDVQYTVTVSGIVGAPQSSYTYTTTIFCPTVTSLPCNYDVVFLYNGTISPGIVRASNSITTSGNLQVSGPVIFSAPDIKLLNGFEVPAGNCFEANGIGCSFYGPLNCQN